MSAHNRVLFVDDEEGVRVSWDRYLSGRGFDVRTASDGEGAIDELKHEPADVVVADLRMPRVDGLGLLRWIHAAQPDTRFILLTGYGDEEVERTARQLGAYEYLDKPIDPETLAAVVTAATHLKLIPSAAEAAALETPEEKAEPVALSAPRSRLRTALEVVGGLLLAPLMGLAFVVFLPLIGFVTLFWFLGSAVVDIFRKPESTEA